MADANRAHWNAALDDGGALNGAVQFLRGQASAFSGAGAVWAPKYRQAHFGAFLTDKPEAGKALDAAYRDVAAAFSAFLAANSNGPIILAGHSQGSRHLMRLMHERVAGNPALAARVAAVYIVGWPVSVEADVPALGLPACTRRGEARCILSWQSFAEPAETGSILHAFEKDAGYTGKLRRGSHMLCVNPLTGMPDSAAAARLNLGTLVLTDPPAASTLVPAAVPARCDARGFLLIGDAPSVGSYVLPGNNFHVYDYSLFWANVRRDVVERLTTFTGS
jgi:hypothetical protein